jgi:hypothetical protein
LRKTQKASYRPETAENAPDLRAVVEAWRSLSDAIKQATLALVNAADAGAGVAGHGSEALMCHYPWN